MNSPILEVTIEGQLRRFRPVWPFETIEAGMWMISKLRAQLGDNDFPQPYEFFQCGKEVPLRYVGTRLDAPEHPFLGINYLFLKEVLE